MCGHAHYNCTVTGEDKCGHAHYNCAVTGEGECGYAYYTTTVLTGKHHAPYMTHILYFSSNFLEMQVPFFRDCTKSGCGPALAPGLWPGRAAQRVL